MKHRKNQTRLKSIPCNPERTSADEMLLARKKWQQLDPIKSQQLSFLVAKHMISVSAGDVQLIDGNWYITHSGLLAIARRKRCSGIQTEIVSELSDSRTSRWVFKAIVFTTPRSKGFVGFGDADPSNVPPLVRGAELRIAETRAVNRALRKAYGVGLCSLEELGAQPSRSAPDPITPANNHNNAGQPRLRDRLLLLIRQNQLDSEQVKHYASQFCGTNSLHEASREQIERLLNHLSALAAQGRDKLLAEIHSARISQQEDAAADTKEAA
jgi:hypothetical protein